jgi:hypothetical protein
MRTLDYLRSQLPAIAPMLVVSLAGMVLALDRLKRLGNPAALALVGCSMCFLATSVFPLVQGYILAAQEDRRWPLAEFSLWMSLFGIARTLVQAIAFAILLAAIFGGGSAPASARKTPKGQTDEVWS